MLRLRRTAAFLALALLLMCGLVSQQTRAWDCYYDWCFYCHLDPVHGWICDAKHDDGRCDCGDGGISPCYMVGNCKYVPL